MQRCGSRWKGKQNSLLNMATLKTDLGIVDPDGFYASVIELHEGLSPEASQKVNAKLILLLANQIGNRKILDEALAYVRSSLNK